MCAKAIVICKEVQSGASKGSPDLTTAMSGWVMVGDLPGAYAIYVIAATGAQLTSIQAEANCVGGALITDAGVRWPELDVAIPSALRTKINNYLTANSQPTLGAGVTLLQVARKAANNFDYGTHDVFDPG
jgi:hypothetical protein